MCIIFLITLVLVGIKNEIMSWIVDNLNAGKDKALVEGLYEKCYFCAGVLIVPAKRSIIFV
jgi:hypothetical protein